MITKNFEDKVGSWQQQVVVKRGKEEGGEELELRQSELMTAARGGTTILFEYLRRELGVKNRSDMLEEEREIPLLVRRLTVDEARYVPVELEREIAAGLATISAADAARPAFWTAAHIVWAEENLLEEGWAKKLVSKGKDMDVTARNVCRNLGGLPHIRGKTSVLVDCPLARAWWRVRIANLIAEAGLDLELDVYDTHRILHRSPVWEVLTGELVRRLAVMNEPRALAALVNFFNKGNIEKINKDHFKQMIHRMASYSTVINFSVAPFADMMELCSAVGQEGFTGSS